MKNLLISTLEKNSTYSNTVIKELDSAGFKSSLISTDGLKISHCIGCNDCWIKTPGLCCIKDDYEKILIKMLLADRVIILTEAKLGFVSSRTKNIIDRILPLATMHLKIQNGQMRHYSRYNKMPDMGLLFIGNAQQDYLKLWLDRVMLNLHGTSLGAFEFAGRKELYHGLSSH